MWLRSGPLVNPPIHRHMEYFKVKLPRSTKKKQKKKPSPSSKVGSRFFPWDLLPPHLDGPLFLSADFEQRTFGSCATFPESGFGVGSREQIGARVDGPTTASSRADLEIEA